MATSDSRTSKVPQPAYRMARKPAPKSAAEPSSEQSYDRKILRSLRRIVRAIDLYSRDVRSVCGLTVPQLICLTAAAREDRITSAALALRVHLSPSTLVGILDRLEQKQLVTRTRSEVDRRQLLIHVTKKGQEAIANAPSPLQDNLASGLRGLSVKEQVAIVDSLATIVDLMEADELKVAPLLTLERTSFVAIRNEWKKPQQG